MQRDREIHVDLILRLRNEVTSGMRPEDYQTAFDFADAVIARWELLYPDEPIDEDDVFEAAQLTTEVA